MRRWNMVKKTSLKKPSPDPTRWRTRRVGSGTTKKTVKWITAEEFVKIPPENWNARVAEASGRNESVAWALGILKKAKLPTDPGRMHPRPGGGLCTLLDLAVLNRRKELDAPEWFAAKILTAWHGVEAAKAALLTPQLPDRARRWYESEIHRHTWELAETVTTAKMKFRWEPDVLARQRSKKGPRKGVRNGKRRLGIEQTIRDRLTKSPRLPARALFDQFLRHRENDPLRTIVPGRGVYIIYGITEGRSGAVMLCERSPGGTTRHLRFRAFEEYASRVKKEIPA
jgi:hypothetical protein